MDLIKALRSNSLKKLSDQIVLTLSMATHPSVRHIEEVSSDTKFSF